MFATLHTCVCRVLPADYYYPDDRRKTLYGPRPDFSKPHVREWLADSLIMWLGEYNFDGVRVDSISTLRRCDDASHGCRGNLLDVRVVPCRRWNPSYGLPLLLRGHD